MKVKENMGQRLTPSFWLSIFSTFNLLRLNLKDKVNVSELLSSPSPKGEAIIHLWSYILVYESRAREIKDEASTKVP